MFETVVTEYDPAALIEVGRLEAEIGNLVRRKTAILTNVERRAKVLTPAQRLASVHLKASRRFGRDVRREWRLSDLGRRLLEILVDVRKHYRRRGNDLYNGVPVKLASLGKMLGRERGRPYTNRHVISTLDHLEELKYIVREQERKGRRFGRLRVWIRGLDLLERVEAKSTVKTAVGVKS